MCNVCGCGEGNGMIVKAPDEQGHALHAHGAEHHHHHGRGAGGNGQEAPHHHGEVHHRETGDLDYGTGPAGAHAPGLSQSRMVQIEQDILAKNDAFAAANRKQFVDNGVFALNLLSGPGAGKTTWLVRTIEALKGRLPVAVIVGDQQTSADADRIRATGVPAIQVNTGKGCHLDAHMVGHALEHLRVEDASVLFIENVGNLVCPAAFDLGEAHKVVILSVTEGEDKPLKYPDMFAAADLMLISKIDLLAHVDFDVDRSIDHARRVNPDIEVMQLSAKSGEGLDAWLSWLHTKRMAVLRQRIEKLESELEIARRGLEQAGTA